MPSLQFIFERVVKCSHMLHQTSNHNWGAEHLFRQLVCAFRLFTQRMSINHFRCHTKTNFNPLMSLEINKMSCVHFCQYSIKMSMCQKKAWTLYYRIKSPNTSDNERWLDVNEMPIESDCINNSEVISFYLKHSLMEMWLVFYII